MKVAIVSSCGGHLTEVRELMPAFLNEPHFYVLNERISLPDDMQGRTYFITHSERDWKFLLNIWEAVQILKLERPTAILSTGAGAVVPFALIGRAFFGTRVVFVETMTRVDRPSMTAQIMYWLAHDFFYQWPQLGRYFPKGTCGGLLV